MAVGDVYQHRVYYHMTQRQYITTFHYRETVEETAGFPAEALAAAWAVQHDAGFRSIISSEGFLGGTITRRIVGGPGPVEIANANNAQGTPLGEAYPGNTGMRINLRGIHQGRSSTGALIISGFPETGIEGNTLNAAYLALVKTNLTDLLAVDLQATSPGTGEWEFGFMSRAPVTPPDPPIAWPGQFVKPLQIAANPIPVTIRSRQGTHQGLRDALP